MAQSAPPPPALQRPIRFDNGIVLTVSLEAARDTVIWIDSQTQQALLGPVVTLAIRNASSGSVAQTFTSLLDENDDVRLHYQPLDGSPEETVGPEAQELVGSIVGYQSTLRGGGIAVRGECIDNAAVAVRDANDYRIGVATMICTKPGDTDRVRFLFPRPTRPSKAVLVLVKCAGCPPGGIRLDAGVHKP